MQKRSRSVLKKKKKITEPAAVSLDQPKSKKLDREKNPAAVLLGQLGGLIGGDARAKALTPAQRKAIAKKASLKRWENHVTIGKSRQKPSKREAG